MKSLTLILGCLILAALILPLLMAAAKASPLGSLKTIRRALGLHVGILRINGLTDGVYANGRPGFLLADAALSARYLMVKRGSDAGHFALCGASDKPLGPCLDEPSAAEAPATIALLGAVEGTQRGVASEAIAVDADVYTAANGKLQDLPAGAGTYYRVGRAFTAATGDGDVFTFTPCLPVPVTVT